MAHRIEVASTIHDPRSADLQRKLTRAGILGINDLKLVNVYTIDGKIDPTQLEDVARGLYNRVVQQATVNQPIIEEGFDYAIEIGFRPGVTDNVGNTTTEGIEDLIGTAEERRAYSSQLLLVSGDLTEADAERIAGELSNHLIQRSTILSFTKYNAEGGMPTVIPKVQLGNTPPVGLVDILGADDRELQRIGKMGIFDHNRELDPTEYSTLRLAFASDELRQGDVFEESGKFYQKVRRGPLALSLEYMKTIQTHFTGLDRNPNDIELESIAQTWSEHCKHTIFADPMDDVTEGIYKRYIKGATERIRKEKGDSDFCVSVFKDNAGAIIFDKNHLFVLKVETHNSPSALDPFGGSITGIVGVNRDIMGMGLGALPMINTYGFCFGNPDDSRALYKGRDFTQRMLSPRRIMEGVIEGVNVGGNCSGIPTPQGFATFHDGYRGKPLVFVGTGGIMPRVSAGRPSHEKKAEAGDYIVMIGGRVGKDGIHGATFSSEVMDSGSPATAVQIGDPITQKKMSDALIKEARDRGLYTSITDNGAGGLSCSVAEMAEECGGCYVNLDDIPLKYNGLAPWETWISESQERMTLSVPKEKWEEFSKLMVRRGVEATRIGEFTDSGNCVVEHNGEEIFNLELEFLHNGLPKRHMRTTYIKPTHEEPVMETIDDLTNSLHSMLSRHNIASKAFISQQYDHEVKAGSIMKPLQGKGRVNGDASVTRPIRKSEKGVILSQGINPTYSEIDTGAMAAAAIDTAIRNAIAAGADLEHLALLDNFCWCSSDEPERLGQLKAAAEACYETAVAYGTPFISGKDSMFNDFKGFDEDGNPVKISIPPTLLVSSVGVIEYVEKSVSLDAKIEGDLVYVIGETHDELGASEYFAMVGEEKRGEAYIGNSVPRVDIDRNKKAYHALSKAIDEEYVASAQSVHIGGLAVALAKTAMGGKLGMHISLENIEGGVSRDDFALYSESQGRIVVTVAAEYKDEFEEKMKGVACTEIGAVTGKNTFTIKGKSGSTIVNTTVDTMLQQYRQTFEGH